MVNAVQQLMHADNRRVDLRSGFKLKTALVNEHLTTDRHLYFLKSWVHSYVVTHPLEVTSEGIYKGNEGVSLM